jgi:hypothetical protein
MPNELNSPYWRKAINEARDSDAVSSV